MIRSSILHILIHTIFFSLCLFIIFFPLYRQTILAPDATYYARVHGKLSDYYSYISYIRQGGIQLHQTNQYAIEDAAPRWTHGYYLLLGRVGRWVRASPLDLYYFGIATSFVLFYVYTMKLVSLVFSSRYRVLAMVFIFFGGPFPPIAGISIGPEITISSVWWTKMDQYNRLTLIPHHFLAVACLVAAAYYFLRFLRDFRWRWVGWCLGFVSFGTVFFSMPGFIFFLAVLCFTLYLCLQRLETASRRRLILGCFLIILGTFSTQLMMYHLYKNAQMSWIDPMVWEYQTHRKEVFPTVFSVYLFSFGLLLLFLPISLVATIRKRAPSAIFLSLLFAIPPILYLASVSGLVPINKLRFVSSAPYVFAGILASQGIQWLFGRFSSVAARRVAWSILIAVIGFNVVVGFMAYWLPLTRKGEPYKNVYIPKENLEAIEYLHRTAPPYTAVMTNWVSGAYVPAFSFMKVFVGHEFNTPDFAQSQQTADRFYRGEMSSDEAKLLLRRYGIEYVLWDMYFPVAAYSAFLTPVYTGKSVILYRVNTETIGS